MAELSRSQILKDPEILGTSTSGAKIVLRDGDESNTMTLKAPDTIGTDFTLTFPANDGVNGQFLQTDGNGVMTWAASANSPPGGVSGDIQFNSSGIFGGATNLTTDGTNLTVKATGEIRLADTDSSNYVALKSPGTVAANRTYTLPALIGSVGQVLKIATGSSSTAATLEWADDLQATGTLTAQGADGTIQLSNGLGGFTSDALLTYNTTTDILSAPQITVDNLNINGNTISSTTGDIILDPLSTNPVSIAGGSPLRLFGSVSTNVSVGIAVPATVGGSGYTLTLPSTIGAADDIMAINGTGDLSFISNYRTINFVIDGGGAVITSGQKGHIVVDFDCTILSWTILSDVTGSITLDIWKSTYAAFPPVVGGSIVGAGTKPSLTTAVKNQSLTPNWTTLTINAGDILAFNADATPATVQRVTIALKVKLT